MKHYITILIFLLISCWTYGQEVVNEFDPTNPPEPSAQYRLDLQVFPSGGGSTSGGGKYILGQRVWVSAYTSNGFQFKHWKKGDEVISTSASFYYVIESENAMLTAHYEYNPTSPDEPQQEKLKHKLYLEAEPSAGGSFNTNSGERYQEDASIYLRAYNYSGFVFSHWSLDGTTVSTSQNLTHKMGTEDQTLKAVFVYNPGNPEEPGKPQEQEYALIALTERTAPGKTIAYPVYLLNHNINVTSVSFDIQFPESVLVNYQSATLTGRRNGHTLTADSLGDNKYHFVVGGTDYIQGCEGALVYIPLTLPDTWLNGENQPVMLSNVLLDEVVSAPVKDGALVSYIDETKLNIYANFLPDIFMNRVLFTNLSSESADAYLWDFGDGTTSTEKDPFHIFETSGDFTVKLIASTEYAADSIQLKVSVSPKESWRWSGTVSLDKDKKEAKNFTDAGELFASMNQGSINGNINVQIQSGQDFEMSLSAELDLILASLKNKLANGNRSLNLVSIGGGGKPSINFTGIPNSDYFKTLAELGKYLSLDNVIIKIFDSPIDVTAIHSISSQIVCSDNETEVVDFTQISPTMTFKWNVVNTSATITGYTQQGENVIPAQALTNSSNEPDSLQYKVEVQLLSMTLYESTYKIVVLPTIKGTLGELSPSNSEVLTTPTVNFSWQNIYNSVYDLYLWESDDEVPAEPLVSGLTNFRYKNNSYCEYGRIYKWKVIARNDCNTIESEIETFSIRPLPDLHVTAINHSDIYAGRTLSVSWTVKNDGRGGTGVTSWKEYIWLVPDIFTGTTNECTLLKEVNNVAALQANESYENSAELTIPERISGNYYLLVTADMYNLDQIDWSPVNNQIPVPYTPSLTGDPYPYLQAVTNSYYNKVEEVNETSTVSDNFFYKKIDIALPPLPDLQITSIIPPDNFYSGQEVTVVAQITNKGEGNIVNKQWRDALYLSRDNSLNLETARYMGSVYRHGNLNKEESYTVELKATVPLEYYGSAYFFVVTDIDDRVYEHANAANNTSASHEVNIILTPPADLSVVSLKLPEIISTGANSDVSVQIKNEGAGHSNVRSWSDKVYLSKKNTGIDNTAIEIVRNYRSGHTMTPGETYTINKTIRPGNLTEGEYYVYVMTDVNNEVFELDSKENNVLLAENTVKVVKPDLIVSLESVPEMIDSGSSCFLAWKIKNVGEGDIKDRDVRDYLYISRNMNGSGAVSLGTFTNNLWLKSGEEKIIRENITLPYQAELNGTCYLFVRTDDYNAVYEKNENNNLSEAVELIYRYIPKPDISVSNLSFSSEIAPGEALSVRYKINNVGPVGINNVQYTQKIYLSTKQLLDESAFLCKVESQTGDASTIPAGGSVEMTQVIRIPGNAKGGTQYVLIVLDKEVVLDEANTNNNTANRSIFIAGNLPDLSIVDSQLPELILSGTAFELEWTVTNSGTVRCNNWSDVVYLSTDNSLDSSDERLYIVQQEELKPGESYTRKATITIPDKWNGNRFIIIKTDENNLLTEVNKTNNVKVIPVTVSLSSLPDLQLESISLSDECISGQPAKIYYTVKNVGAHATRQDKWTDEFYLSETTTLDRSRDRNLGNKLHVGILEVNESYTDSIEITIPSNASGNYSLFVYTDGRGTIFEAGNTDNNKKHTTINVRRPLPCDLIVTDIIAPVNIIAGEEISISYKVKNSGAYPASGILKDAIYVSEDAMWDANDLMVGTTSGYLSAEPGASVSRTATGRFTNVPTGSYYIIIRTNLTNSIIENSMTNNYASSQSRSNVDFREIVPGSSEVVGLAGYFKVKTSGSLVGETLALNLEDDDENVHTGLYLAHEKVPTVAEYDYSSSKLQVSNQEVIIPAMKEGMYYILAQDNSTNLSGMNNLFNLNGSSSSGSSTINLNLSARILQFEIISVQTSEGGSGGLVTSDITGAKFDSIMDFRLKRADEYIPAEAIYFRDQTLSMVTFNLMEASAGSYDVIAELPGGLTTELGSGYTVVPGVSVPLYTKIVAPSSVRLSSKIPFAVEYGNNGSTDVAVAELLLVSRNGHPIGLNTQELDSLRTEIRIPLYETGNANKPTVLSPGVKGTRTVFVHADTAATISLRLYIIRKDY